MSADPPARPGPLAGLRVVEVGSIGPGPFAAMLLADLGAQVIRLDRPPSPDAGELGAGAWNLLHRGRPSVGIDLKRPGARDLVLGLCARSDALLEGFRPGVMERLGLGPDAVLEASPRIVYGRITGYGQQGPMAHVAGHDINYIALSGALSGFARAGERPLAPLNVVGDFGGGGMLLAIGVLSAIIEARQSGRGQVVDAAMVDGSALMLSLFHGMHAAGMWSTTPGTNFLDSGAHFYEVYETADGRHVTTGAIEPQFYAELLRILEVDPADAPQWDRKRWPELKQRFAAIFATRSQAEWVERFERAEACTTGVYGLLEAVDHPHNAARRTFIDVAGTMQPAPAPRFSRTPSGVPSPPSDPGADTEAALLEWGLTAAELAQLRRAGAVT